MTPMLDPRTLDVGEETERDDYQADPADEVEPCPFCAWLNYPRGTMGRLLQYHCSDCGGWYHTRSDER
jgi:hypothetical protein